MRIEGEACGLLGAARAPANTDDKVLLDIVVEREASARGLEVNGAARGVLLSVGRVGAGRDVANATGQGVVGVQDEVVRAALFDAALLDGGGGENASHRREAKGKGGNGNHVGNRRMSEAWKLRMDAWLESWSLVEKLRPSPRSLYVLEVVFTAFEWTTATLALTGQGRGPRVSVAPGAQSGHPELRC